VFWTFFAVALLAAVALQHTPSKKKSRAAVIAALVLVVVALGAALIVRVYQSHSLSKVTPAMMSWRARLLLLKVEGDPPDLSWRELWFMIQARGGFGLSGYVREKYSLEATVSNPYVTTKDDESGKRIFASSCAVCHGVNGAGGHAPALNRARLNHGDSDFAIYKIVRDGIPQTGMAGVPMSPRQRWQVIGYLRTLRPCSCETNADRLPAIKLEVSPNDIRAAGSRPDQWLTYSGSLDGRRYTPLAQITPQNVSHLQIRWIRQFLSGEAMSEATPIVANGTIFTTEPTPSAVDALDVKSGYVRWRYERGLPDRLPACCFRANRGVAVLGDTVFLGSLDGYLVALNASDGSVLWQTQVANSSNGFTMTGAPLIVNQSVVVGVAGGEYGIRGFVAAYDAKTGQQQWRFDTIPAPGEFGHDTWKNDAWQTGGGPTWITGSYDPVLDLVYWGVGNPAPGLQGDVRPGDNLFTDSLVALHGNSGKLAWYFQFTPHDEYDRDATQTPVLADISINGVLRHVVCVANRNGFYYVLDRTNGEFLTGVPYVKQNWAKGLDSTGRPILAEEAATSAQGRLVRPGVGGGTNWQNSAYDPRKGLVFVPATESGSVFVKSPVPRHGELGFFSGSEAADYKEPEQRVVRALDAATGAIRWERWERTLPSSSRSLANGYSGLLATGGGLVFGASGGFIFATDSQTGRELWRVSLGGDTFAAPISFTMDGHQMIVISAGRALFAFGL
jgi:alcohol dehydrogenase (cytochrome c)